MPAALAEYEAVAALVVRAGGTLGVVVVLGHRHHVGEGRDGQRVDGRLGTTGDDDVGTARADHLGRVADRFGAGRARADQRVNTRLRAEFEPDVGGRAVRHEHGDGVRGDAAYALLLEHVVLVEQGGDATDTGGDDRTEALGVYGVVLMRPSR